jgi:ATP adenylyltransferase
MVELFNFVRVCCNVLSEALAPQGFNIGVNLGKVAGAGIDDHLHIHVVPRWSGDSNFMTVTAGIRVIPEDLFSTYDKLLPLFREQNEA